MKLKWSLMILACFMTSPAWADHVKDDMLRVSSDMVYRSEQLHRSISAGPDSALLPEVKLQTTRIERRAAKLRELAQWVQTRRGPYPHLVYQWIHYEDRVPNMCRGTGQGPDRNPYLVKNPQDAGAICDEKTEDQLFCDAGVENGRGLDRFWICAWN